ncbi:DMT family transporter [Aestuariivirga sp.]|uniref:DMT family transporter n=1 Tax=Aestuariivirga sp. TaxID=2650926 RepID=UPI0035934E50
MDRTKQPSPQQIRIAFLVTAVGGLLFTFDLPLLRLSLADQWTMVFTRGVFLFLAIAGAWLMARLLKGDRTPFIAGAAGLAVICSSTIGNMAYIGAIVHTNAANVVFIIALTPVIAATLSRSVLGERIHPFTWAATVMAFLGAAIIAWDGIHSGDVLGDALAFISACSSATAFTIIRASGKKVATCLAVGSLVSALIALIFFGVMPSLLLADGAFGLPAWFWLGLNGFIAIPLATVLLASGPRVLPSADVSMFFMLETVLTPVWIWLLFGEVPGRMVLIGGLLVIVTLMAHSWWRLALSVKQQPELVPNRQT